MKAVILAAGKGTRMHPLTLTRAKCMLPVMGRPILEHNLEQLKGLVKEVVLVTGHLGEQVRGHFGSNYQGLRIRYAEQKGQKGTGHALAQARDALGEEFLVMNGDDIYSRQDLKACMKNKLCVMAMGVERPEDFGVVRVQGRGLKRIEEKVRNPGTNLVNTGVYRLNRGVFGVRAGKSQRGELELTDMVNRLAERERVVCEKARGFWFPVGYPWNLLEANEFLLQEMERPRNMGKTEDNVVIKGDVSVGKGTLLRSGAYIEGPVYIGSNCTIGPNCFIRPFTSIGNGCKIGNGVEVKNCIIGDNTSIGHLSYFGDSVLGSNINIGAGTMTANLRHDNGNVRSSVKGKILDTGRRKLGAVIGDGVHTGIHTSIYPGRKLWPGRQTLPGQVVKRDLV
jgi:bifunctional UDP-N-acetylglucosamine pyrophosphorylase/glucosamine-1-phosphate N-acetyltransferase